MSKCTYTSPECLILAEQVEGVICSSPVELPDSNWFDEKEI